MKFFSRDLLIQSTIYKQSIIRRRGGGLINFLALKGGGSI